MDVPIFGGSQVQGLGYGANVSKRPIIQSSTSEMNGLLMECLVEILQPSPMLVGSDVKSAEDVMDKYHVFRSFRRGSEFRAVAMKVSDADIYVVNCWRRKEIAGAPSQVNHPIDQHYKDVSLVSLSYFQYTKAM